LLRSIAALDEPSGGKVLIEGVDAWAEPRKAHRHIGFLPDHFGLYKGLPAWECLLHAARSRGLASDAAKPAAAWALSTVGLEAKREALAGTLSRGQRQRLALAQAIVHRPRLLLLDEPASGLDPGARADLAALMRMLAGQGMTILVSSHILAELEDYCSAMLALEKGRVAAHQALGASPENTARQIAIRLADPQKLAPLALWLQGRGLAADAPAENGQALLAAGQLDDAGQGRLLADLLQAGFPVLEFAQRHENLQAAYLKTVGGASRQAAKEANDGQP
jgi:ABC-2 type transport system ATP-binding protein